MLQVHSQDFLYQKHKQNNDGYSSSIHIEILKINFCKIQLWKWLSFYLPERRHNSPVCNSKEQHTHSVPDNLCKRRMVVTVVIRRS